MGKLENNSIPVNIANQIIDDLPKELFNDPSKKFCYASIVDDYVIRKLYDKLNEGLENIIEDENERRRHILNNMIYGISLSNARTRLVKARSIIKNIYTKNILEDDLSDMPKFDFIIQNPPYCGALHLDFFNKGLDLLSNTGKMVIIEPSTWLINLNPNSEYNTGKRKNLTPQIKKLIEGHVSKVIIENYNTLFGTGNDVPFSITYIDKSKQYKKIEYSNCGIKKYVNSLYDCNLIGNIETIKSIFEKIKIYDKLINHRFIPNKSEKIEGNYYCKYAGIVTGALSWHNTDYEIAYSWDSFYLKNKINNQYYNAYIKVCINNDVNNWIFNYVPYKRLAGGGKTKNIRYSDKEAECVTGTKQELENWKHYVFNNSLPLFINICMTIDQHNNSLHYVPWLVDKKYTDQEIYNMFGFTNEEIKLIETTIKKYERYSPWFKRYMCGPNSVSDEEVQKFINELENEKN